MILRIKNFFKRIYDLAIKIISVKGIFAVMSTVVFVFNPSSNQTFGGFIIAWCVFIGSREFAKFQGLLPMVTGLKGGNKGEKEN